jgi:hypothetical protein
LLAAAGDQQAGTGEEGEPPQGQDCAVPLLTTPALEAGILADRPQPELPADGLRLRPWQPGDRRMRGAARHTDGWHDMHRHARLAADGWVSAARARTGLPGRY